MSPGTVTYDESMTASGEFLALALRGERGESQRKRLAALHRQLGDAACLKESRRNQVAPLVADALADALGGGLPAEWSAILERNAGRVDELIDAVAAVGRRLDSMGCRWAAVEAGGVMLGTRLPTRAYCPGDIDLLVDEARFADARECLHAEGFVEHDRRARPTKRVEMFREGREGEQWLEVGCEPFDRMWVPLLVGDRRDVWLERRIQSRKREGVCVLRPADALAFVAMHTSLHSYVRAPGLRLHVDVDRLVRDCEVDWDGVVHEVRAMGIGRRAFVSLAMAAGVLATPVPERVLSALLPGKLWWGAIARLLRTEGVIADGRPKLGRGRTVLLDALLDERGPIPWASSLLVPPTDWMREHFDRAGEGRPVVELHLQRYRQLLERWRPQ